MRIIVAVAIGAFFGFAAMAMLGIEARQKAYEEGLRDGIRKGEESVREECRYVRLPVDAKGEAIHIGDEIIAGREGGADDGNQSS